MVIYLLPFFFQFLIKLSVKINLIGMVRVRAFSQSVQLMRVLKSPLGMLRRKSGNWFSLSHYVRESNPFSSKS